ILFARVLTGVLVAGTLAALVEGGFLQQVLGPTSAGSGLSSAAAGRDPLKWPFSRDSIWNLPIGSNARYVWAGIRHATSMAYFNDADILVLTPSAPSTTVYANYDDWGSGNRCSAQGGALFDAPMPANFVIPGSHQGSEDGDTPNAAAALLAADGHSLIQTQPFARCAGQSPTSHYMFWPEELYGTGETGSHGGSGLSALGGTVRHGALSGRKHLSRVPELLGLPAQRRRRRERLGPGPRQDFHEPVRRRQLGQGHLADRVGIERHGRRGTRNPAGPVGPRVRSGSSPASPSSAWGLDASGEHDQPRRDAGSRGLVPLLRLRDDRRDGRRIGRRFDPPAS